MNNLENNFTYHAHKGDQTDRYVLLRAAAKELAELIVENVPESRERSLALIKLKETSMWANAGIARNK